MHVVLFFFSSRRRHTRYWRDWSSDVCSSDLADEPQYLLTAISLATDGDLDIADELADGRWRPFHALPLPTQTEPLADGRRLSPHNPLLPLLLAGPVAAGGWVVAKPAMAGSVGPRAVPPGGDGRAR